MSRQSEPVHTLYVHDRHARESEQYLQREIHTVALNKGALDAYSEFSELGMQRAGFEGGIEFSNILESGRFRYIAAKKSRAFPIGIYRLRFRPKTRDAGIGIEAERRRVQEWVPALQRLCARHKSA